MSKIGFSGRKSTFYSLKTGSKGTKMDDFILYNYLINNQLFNKMQNIWKGV
jgi:hypothetical protein